MARRAELGTAHALASAGKIGGAFVPTNHPVYIEHRIRLFNELHAAQQEQLKAKPHNPVIITLPDGSKKEGRAYETSPMDIAMEISKGLAQVSIVAKIMYESETSQSKIVDADAEDSDDEGDAEAAWILWDMTRPLEGSCQMQLLKFDDEQARHVFWHSSAHILGQSLEAEFGAHLTVGPALDHGFYYDCYVGDKLHFNQDLYPAIERQAERAIDENQPFVRLAITKEQALEMFKHNPFKIQLISNKIPDGCTTSVYRCGSLIDLCRGPHLPRTGMVKAFSIEKNSSAYWLGSASNDSLQRVYAISFPDTKRMKEYKKFLEEAKKRDHRTIGTNLNLFFFHPDFSPGSCFWLPDGAIIYNKLLDFFRAEYRHRGFYEVMSPNIFSAELFKVSGHYQNYQDSMYMFDVEGREWGMKPMNCPGHCIMFRHMNPSYRQLPLRLADFGVLHRKELSGSLTGLTRVRRFQQDDAHIFVRKDQIKEEVTKALEFLFFVYDAFGFTFEVKLSTRPKKALGDIKLWNEAEAQLEEALNDSGLKWSLNPGDGAFYGPKIDIQLQDAIQRHHQCGTIQLDFQLPLRFNLSYRTSDVAEKKEEASVQLLEKETKIDVAHPSGSWETELKPGHARPVIIHRAILGSVERMTAVLLEHTAGKLPFWLSPRQCKVLPISEKFSRYGQWVRSTLQSFAFHVALDETSNTINKKIREAQLEQWNYILVVGQKEEEGEYVTVRVREDPQNQKQVKLPALIEQLEKENVPSSAKLRHYEPYKRKLDAVDIASNSVAGGHSG